MSMAMDDLAIVPGSSSVAKKKDTMDDGAMVNRLDRDRCSPNVAQLASAYPWRAMQRLASIWYDLGALQHRASGIMSRELADCE